MTQTLTPEDTCSLLSPAEVAAIAGVSRKTIYREVERGELRATRVGHQIRIARGDLDLYLEREAGDLARRAA